MPSKKKAGTVRILSQIPELVHQVADKRRRAEGLTWDALLVTLLTRWAAGADDGALAAPMRATRSRATGPDAEAFRAKVRFVTDIGTRLEPLLVNYCAAQLNVALLEKSDGGLTVEISGQNVRFRVDGDVWEHGLDFEEAVKLIKALILSPSQ